MKHIIKTTALTALKTAALGLSGIAMSSGAGVVIGGHEWQGSVTGNAKSVSEGAAIAVGQVEGT